MGRGRERGSARPHHGCAAGHPRRGARPRTRSPLGHDGVRLAAAEVGGAEADDLAIVKADEVELLPRACRPAARPGPAASPLLEDEPARPDGPGSPPSAGWGEPLPEWTAPGLALEPGAAARLTLALCAADPWSAVVTGEPNVVLATDLRFAAKAADLVVELITRGRILPDLELTTGRPAHWRPLVDRNDRGRIEALSWNLPASFTCAGTAEGGHRPGTGSGPPAPPDVVRSYMWSVTDALTRRFLADRPPAKPPPSRRRRPPGADAVDAWLSALTSPDGVLAGPGASSTTSAYPPPKVSLARRGAGGPRHATADTWPPRRCAPASASNPYDCRRRGRGRGRGRPRGPGRPATRRVSGTDPGTAREPAARPSMLARSLPGRTTGGSSLRLQAVDDPSLFVRAPAVWADGPELTALEHQPSRTPTRCSCGAPRARWARLVPSLGPAAGHGDAL